MENPTGIESIEIESFSLDNVIKLLKMTYSLELWPTLVSYSDSLFKRLTSKNNTNEKCKRPLIYYLGYSQLMKGLGLKNLRRFNEALERVKYYSDLSWYASEEEGTKKEIEYFSYIAKPNTIEIKLLSGKFEILDEYTEFLLSNEKEILPGLISILEAANIHNINVDSTLAIFATHIEEIKKQNFNGLINFSYVHSFLFEQIKYYLNRSYYQPAIETSLQLLHLSEKTDNVKVFKRAVAFFEVLRDKATTTQINTYKTLVKGVVENEKNVNISNLDSLIN